MFVTQICLIILIFTFILLNIKNRYASVIALYLTSITYMLFIATIYISKIHYYNFPLRIDYILYLKLSTLHISMSQITICYNFGFALFMFSSLYGARQIIKINMKLLIPLTLPILFFMLCTYPNIARFFYVYQHTAGTGLNIMNYIDGICKVIIVLYSMLPYWYTTKFYHDTSFRQNKHNILILALCITIINIYFYSFFIFGAFKCILFCNVNPAGLPVNQINIGNYLPISMITFVIILTAIILLMIFKPFNLFYFKYNKNKDIEEGTQFLNNNFSANLHMYKNMFWGARQQFELIKVAMEAKDYDSIIEYANDGIHMSNQHLEQLQHTLNAFSNDTMALGNVDIVECMENAVEKSKSVLKINIIREYTPENIFTYGNAYILTEAFSNLVINAIESFEKHYNPDPTIIIRIQLEDNICMIEITDNGCGIPKKELKKIFEPFYSSKSKTKNFGIGLNFVKKIIKSYHGTLAVVSKVNKYTTFQITIPVSTKAQERKDKNEYNKCSYVR